MKADLELISKNAGLLEIYRVLQVRSGGCQRRPLVSSLTSSPIYCSRSSQVASVYKLNMKADLELISNNAGLLQTYKATSGSFGRVAA